MNQSYESEMEKCRVLIYGVNSNQSIKERIAAIYSDERLAQGEELYQTAKNAGTQQTIEKQEGRKAIKAHEQSIKDIHEVFISIRDAGRYFYKNDLNMQRVLMLDKKVPSNQPGWKALVENTIMAIRSNPEIQTNMAMTGISTELIASTLTALQNLNELRIVAEKEDGEAQQATQYKQETFSELKTYCSDLRECLGLFFKGRDRQKLEEVGIVVK